MQFFKVKTVEETFQLIDELIPATKKTKLENWRTRFIIF
jgi:hypothetical protein